MYLFRPSWPLFLLAVNLFATPLATPAAVAESAVIGRPHPELSLPDLEGKVQNLSQWRGKVLVINFWATWCGPCLEEIPMFNSLQKLFGEQKVQFIGIAVDNPGAIGKFIQRTPIHYQNLVGGFEGAALAEDFGNDRGALPFTVFVDKSGHIKAIALGKLTEQATRANIEKLL